MKRVLMIAAVIVVFASAPAYSSPPGPPVGKALPDFTLKIPEDAVQRGYLGLKEKNAFSIPDIDAQVVVIEVFSMY